MPTRPGAATPPNCIPHSSGPPHRRRGPVPVLDRLAGPSGWEGPEGGGLRFPIQSRLAGRLFERIRLDVNLSPDDPRPVEALQLPNHFAFAGLPAIVVPAISAAQQQAEKLHAYTRDYGVGENTRAKDLYDMLLIAADLPVPPLGELAEACATTFLLRDTTWPPNLVAQPGTWSRPWAGFVRDYGIGFVTLTDAYLGLVAFWGPVLTSVGAPDAGNPLPGPGDRHEPNADEPT